LKTTKTFFLLLISVMIMAPTVNALRFSHLMTYTDGDGLGSLQFSSDFTATSIFVGDAQVTVYNLKHNGENTFGVIGFVIDENATLTVTECTPGITRITYTGNGTNSIYIPGKGMPSSVLGVDTWSYNHADDNLTFTQNEDSTIVIDWGVDFQEIQLQALRNLDFLGIGIFVLIAGAAVMLISTGANVEQLIQIALIAGGVGLVILIISSVVMHI